MKKICIVTTSLGKGGAERSTAILSKVLSQLPFEIHILMTKNDIDYEFSGILFNLEEKIGKNLSNLKKAKALKVYFKKHNFDIIIDNRTRPSFLKEYILYKYIFIAKKTIPVVRSYHLRYYFPENKFLARILYKNKITIVAVSKGIKNAVKKTYGLNNCTQIYNPLEIETITKKANNEVSTPLDYILWYGRIEEEVKNLNLLLKAYKTSTLIKKNIKLLIIGQGKDLNILKKMIINLKLQENVHYFPFLKNPFPYVKKAKFTVLTSYYEGFPRVLIESLACGTPVISVNCESGPKEIVKHEYNGLLVENHDPEALATAFNMFIQDKKLYNTCKQYAKKSIEHLSAEKIKLDWDKVLNEIKL